MDSINIKLIEKMQENAELSLLELSKSVGISKTACWNRLQRMEEENIIKFWVAVWNAASKKHFFFSSSSRVFPFS